MRVGTNIEHSPEKQHGHADRRTAEHNCGHKKIQTAMKPNEVSYVFNPSKSWSHER